MEKINFMFHSDCKSFVTNETSLEDCQHEETAAGGEGSGIVSFVEVEGSECGMAALLAVHHLQLDGGRDSALEQLASIIFRAGVAHGETLKIHEAVRDVLDRWVAGKGDA